MFESANQYVSLQCCNVPKIVRVLNKVKVSLQVVWSQDVGRLVSCAVDVYMLSSAYLVNFTGSCVIAAYHEFIMFYIDTCLYTDLLITRETIEIVIMFRIRVISFRK